MTPELLDIFNRVCDELTTLHGEPFVRTPEPMDRFRQGHEMVTAGWMLDGENHGFKLWAGPEGIEILTWAHVGDFASARAHLRSIDAAEAMLRRILPPAFGISQAAPTPEQGASQC